MKNICEKNCNIFQELEKGKYANTDVYVYHFIVNKDVVLLTDKRIAFLVHNDLFGGWQVSALSYILIILSILPFRTGTATASCDINLILIFSYQVEWYYTWQEVSETPKVVDRGVQVPVRETHKKKKLGNFFGSTDHGKIILVSDYETKQVRLILNIFCTLFSLVVGMEV